MEDKNSHINVAIDFANLIRTTLGPRGMNKMVIDEGANEIILTNDGATIVGHMRGGNPIIELFKNLSHSQEVAIGDGTTTATILAGQLLQNALFLINKGIHPTVIIHGYSLAKIEAMKFLESKREKGDKESIIRTCFGTKLPEDMREILVDWMMQIKDFGKLKVYPMNYSDPRKTEIFHGYVFDGFTINDRMNPDVEGKIAVLDFPINWKMDNFSVTQAEEMEKVQQLDSNFKQKIVDKLVKLGVKAVFYTDTTPEFESYLTDKGITGVVIYDRANVDGICKSIKASAISNIDQIDEFHLGLGHMVYEKQRFGSNGHIYVYGDAETLIVHAQTDHLLKETIRAIDDVMGLMKNELDMVIGAGSIEIEIAKHLREYANQVIGKPQLAVLQFADAIESIPMILAENCGLDAMEMLTTLKTLHANGKTDFGVDIDEGVSDARERKIFEPVLVKIHAINSATNISCLILKIDKILLGQMENNK
jgi:chaperonin GroEL (HSP60 family)